MESEINKIMKDIARINEAILGPKKYNELRARYASKPEPKPEPEILTIHGMKKIIRAILVKHGLNDLVTARTIDFTDLARVSRVFICIHGWQPSPLASELQRAARENGFNIEFK